MPMLLVSFCNHEVEKKNYLEEIESNFSISAVIVDNTISSNSWFCSNHSYTVICW